MSPSVLLSHVTGNINSREAARCLVEAGWLNSFHTTLAFEEDSPFFRWVPSKIRTLLQKRRFHCIPKRLIHRHPWLEILRLLVREIPLLRSIAWLNDKVSIERVADQFDAVVATSVTSGGGIDCVYGYMDSSLKTFRSAKRRGIPTIYELPTAHWTWVESAVAEEMKRSTDWAPTLPVIHASSLQIKRRDEELQLADLIVVPSQFVKKSLEASPGIGGKVVVVPYGCPEPVPHIRRSVAGDLLRVLFVGSLSQTKGLADFLEAMSFLRGEAEATVIGTPISVGTCEALDRGLAQHRFLGSVSHDRVLLEMRAHDVLVLPTLYEGLALVLLEAMSSGLTVITTQPSGIADLIEDGRQGFIVPIRRPDLIAQRLSFLGCNAECLNAMRNEALLWSRDHSWERYRMEWLQAIAGLISNRPYRQVCLPKF